MYQINNDVKIFDSYNVIIDLVYFSVLHSEILLLVFFHFSLKMTLLTRFFIVLLQNYYTFNLQDLEVKPKLNCKYVLCTFLYNVIFNVHLYIMRLNPELLFFKSPINSYS